MSQTIKVIFNDADGNHLVDAEGAVGDTLLDTAHKNGVFQLEGACEGCLACSTCHVVVDGDWFKKLPSADEDEEDMLDLAAGLTLSSRLGCQIVLTADMDGLTVSLPRAVRNNLI